MSLQKNTSPDSFRLIIALGVGIFAGSIGIYTVPLQIGALIDSLQLTASETGLLGAIEIAAMSLTMMLISPLLTRFSLRNIAWYGVVFASLSQFSTAFANSYWLLFMLRLCTGIGCGCVFASACAAAASTREPDRNFGWAQTVMNVIFLILFLVLPYSLHFGLHKGLFISLAILLLMTLPLYNFLPDNREESEDNKLKQEKARVVLIVIHIIATVLLNTGLGALWGFVERIGVTNVGLNSETIGIVLSLATLFMIAGSLFAVWLGVRFGRALPLAGAALICALAAMLVTNAQSLIVYAGGLFLYNFAYLFIGPYIIAGIPSSLDSSGRLAATMGGIMFFSYSLGIGTGGYIAEYLSLSGIGILALCSCVISAPLFILVSKKTVIG